MAQAVWQVTSAANVCVWQVIRACVCLWQVIRAANAEVARGLQNPFYSVWQKLPGPPSKGQAAITSFHFMMNSLLQEVRLPTPQCTFCIYILQLHCFLVL